MTQSIALSPLFDPKSIAIVGASRYPGKVGHEILRNLQLSGYPGKIYPINPKAESICGVPTSKSLSEVPDLIDLAVIALPKEQVLEGMEDCAKNRVKAVIIIATGFSDMRNHELEREVISIAKRSGIRVLGPDTFGIFNARNKMNCTFGSNRILTGNTAFITQSCAVGLALTTWTTDSRYRVCSIASTGTKADIDDADLVDYYTEDESTKSILIYMEGLKNEKKFIESARQAVLSKPIIVIKSGRSKRGALAALSHTGSITGNDAVFDVAFRQAGIVRAETLTEAFDWTMAFNENPLPGGENVVIVTNCGAAGVLAADRCESLGLHVSDIPEDLKALLAETMPIGGSLNNPIDLTTDANERTYRSILNALRHHDAVHGIIVLFVQTDNVDPTLVAKSISTLKEEMQASNKPITISFIGGQLASLAHLILLENRMAAYSAIERAVSSMHVLMTRAKRLRTLTPETQRPVDIEVRNQTRRTLVFPSPEIVEPLTDAQVVEYAQGKNQKGRA